MGAIDDESVKLRIRFLEAEKDLLEWLYKQVKKHERHLICIPGDLQFYKEWATLDQTIPQEWLSLLPPEAIQERLTAELRRTMAEDTVQSTDQPSQDDQTSQTQQSITGSLKEQIASKVASLNSGVRDILIDKLASEEIAKRADTVTRAFAKLVEAEKEYNKIRPSSPGFDENQKELPKTYTHEQIKQRREIAEKKQKLETALQKAFDAGDYSKLNDLVK